MGLVEGTRHLTVGGVCSLFSCRVAHYLRCRQRSIQALRAAFEVAIYLNFSGLRTDRRVLPSDRPPRLFFGGGAGASGAGAGAGADVAFLLFFGGCFGAAAGAATTGAAGCWCLATIAAGGCGGAVCCGAIAATATSPAASARPCTCAMNAATSLCGAGTRRVV